MDDNELKTYEQPMALGWWLVRLNDEILGAICVTGRFMQDSATLVRFLKGQDVRPTEGDVIYYQLAKAQQ